MSFRPAPARKSFSSLVSSGASGAVVSARNGLRINNKPSAAKKIRFINREVSACNDRVQAKTASCSRLQRAVSEIILHRDLRARHGHGPVGDGEKEAEL